jgi:hypothetical protein
MSKGCLHCTWLGWPSTVTEHVSLLAMYLDDATYLSIEVAGTDGLVVGKAS